MSHFLCEMQMPSAGSSEEIQVRKKAWRATQTYKYLRNLQVTKERICLAMLKIS